MEMFEVCSCGHVIKKDVEMVTTVAFSGVYDVVSKSLGTTFIHLLLKLPYKADISVGRMTI